MINFAASVRRAYKYVSPEIAKRMVEKGSVKIGTLHEYKQLEAKRNVRGDQGEGTRVTTAAPGTTRYEDGSSLHRSLLSQAIRVQGAIVTNGANAVVYEQHHPDCFVYCVSEQFSPELQVKFGGACVAITDPAMFFKTLDNAFSQHLQNTGLSVQRAVLDRCLYVPRPQPYYNQLRKHPCFVKDPRFRDEAEIRALWLVSGGTVAPVIMEIPALTPYLDFPNVVEEP